MMGVSLDADARLFWFFVLWGGTGIHYSRYRMCGIFRISIIDTLKIKSALFNGFFRLEKVS